MTITKNILDHCLKYLLNNRAPKTITTSSDEKPVHFGFWVYLKDSNEKFVLMKREGVLTFQCRKFNPTPEEKNVTYTKIVKNNGALFSKNTISVNLFYNGYELSGISPLKSYFYGITKIYKFFKWYGNFVWERTQNKHKKALAHYKDRFRLLEALISIYQDEHDNFSVVIDDAIEINLLALKLTNSNDIPTIYLSREQLDPTLRSLESDELIQILDNGNIKLLPKAWSELSKYIIEERRHTDNQKALKWQRILMFFLVLGSLITAFLTFIRSDVQKNIELFVQGIF